ncbi:phosphoserine phosphatase SerB [Aliikangiella marina]|uniref:Phosphoserine phosphatase n=1 Tax=Aliikangiella marina TaxID=1712262 RepID=A0A545T785_9GAMM|nr:phosphoserine phosphatase SerB [Aliikangiella marina]TQV73042.1 phosphoserine phosphatase SerB [Aliikangiella marina]
MNWSSVKVERKQLYLASDGGVSSVSTARAALQTAEIVKISLFVNKSFDEQVDELGELTRGVPHFCFMLRGDEPTLVWDLYLAREHLEPMIQQELIRSDFDYLIWPENNLQMPPSLLLFDMDSTFIEIEVIDELARQHKVGEKVAAVTEAAMRGELDFAESLISRVACLSGLGVEAIEQIASRLPVSKGVPELVEKAHTNHSKIAIVSGGFKPFVEKLKHDMGLYRVHANQLEVNNDQLTGRVSGDIVDAQAKAVFLEELCQALEITLGQSMAIGDGANDLKMMEKAGFNLAYRAKPKVQATANGRINNTHLGWLAAVFDW